MSSNPAPYNFTITDQSPLFLYSPYRDGVASGGWNASYASGILYGRFGNGPSSHSTTFVGATAQLDWIGTAIYLYGEGSLSGYTIDIDGTTTPASNTPGLLFSQSGLTYGSHSLVLRVVKSGVIQISNATITVGMGEVGSTVQKRTTQTTTVPITANGVALSGFTLSGTWYPQTQYGPDPNPVPRIGANSSGAYISFSLTSASAFYIYGSVNENHGSYAVKMNPPLNITPQTYNGYSHWTGLNTIMYLGMGMDRSMTYQIVMTNNAPDLSNLSTPDLSYLWMDLSEIVVFDAPPSLQPGPSPSQTSPQSSTSSMVPPGPKKVGVGLIVGVAAGGACILLAFLACLFYLRRRRRRQDTGQPARFTTERLSTGDVPPASYTTSWANHSPEVPFGHSSVPGWAVDQYRSRERMKSLHKELGFSVPSIPTNAYSERTRASGPIVDHYEHSGQPRPVHSGSGTFRPSTSTEWRGMSMSDRSSVPSIPLDYNEYRVASPPSDPVPNSETPPAYSPDY